MYTKLNIIKIILILNLIKINNCYNINNKLMNNNYYFPSNFISIQINLLQNLINNQIYDKIINNNNNEFLIHNNEYIEFNNQIDNIGNVNNNKHLLSRNKRYLYIEPEKPLIEKFRKHLTAKEGDEEIALVDVVQDLVAECDRLSRIALNESIKLYADENYLIHYNDTENVYRVYRSKYMDYTESLYHKLIFIMPHIVKRQIRSVFLNVTSDLKHIDIPCMTKYHELELNINKHFLSYGELFRSLLIESYNDIERNFYLMFTDKPQSKFS